MAAVMCMGETKHSPSFTPLLRTICSTWSVMWTICLRFLVSNTRYSVWAFISGPLGCHDDRLVKRGGGRLQPLDIGKPCRVQRPVQIRPLKSTIPGDEMLYCPHTLVLQSQIEMK